MFLGVEVRGASVIRLAIHVVGQVHEVGLLGCLRARKPRVDAAIVVLPETFHSKACTWLLLLKIVRRLMLEKQMLECRCIAVAVVALHTGTGGAAHAARSSAEFRGGSTLRKVFLQIKNAVL